MKNALRIIVTGLAFGALQATSVQALSVTPARTEVRLTPGHHVKTILTVLNDHAEEMQIEASQKNWFMYDANKDVPVTDWLKIHGKTYFRLKPGQKREVPVTITCPPKAEGLLMGMTSFAFQPMEPGMMTPMISVSIYLTAEGTDKKQGEIRALIARLYEGKMHVGAEVVSTGNVHLRPSGTLRILQNGVLISEFRVVEAEPVFPGQSRGFVGQGNSQALKAGDYVLKAEMTSGEVILQAERLFRVDAKGNVTMQEKKPA